LVRIGIDTELPPQRFGVKTPALGERSRAAEPLKVRKRLILLRQADLEVVTRGTFVKIKRLHPGRGAGRKIISVEVEDARAGSVSCSRIVGAAGRAFLGERRDGADLETSPRKRPEQARKLGLQTFADRDIALLKCFPRGWLELGIATDVLEKLLKRPLEPHGSLHCLHLRMNAADIIQSDPVNGIGA
jgi:hypothetical protein